MVRLKAFIVIIGFIVLGGILFINFTSDTFHVKEHDSSKTNETMGDKRSIHEMTDQELIAHFIDHQADYNKYNDFIEENLNMIDFSMEQVMMGASISSNSNWENLSSELVDGVEKGINTTEFYINQARKLKEIPLFSHDIHSTYLKALDEFEQVIDMMESYRGGTVNLALISSEYNTATDYVDETHSKMAELDSFIYRLMSAKEDGTTSNVKQEFQKENEMITEETVSSIPTGIDISPPASEGLYHIQAGAFSAKENALALESDLKAHGFETIIQRDGELYIVQVGAFSVKKKCRRYACETSIIWL